MEVEVLEPRSPLLTSENAIGAIDISGSSSATDDSGMPAFLCDNIDPNYLQLGSDDCKYPLTTVPFVWYYFTDSRSSPVFLKWGCPAEVLKYPSL